MTLQECCSKILTLEHLIGKFTPDTKREIIEIIPSPIDENSLPTFLKVLTMSKSIKEAANASNSYDFEIMLIHKFSKKEGRFEFSYFSDYPELLD